MSHVDYKFDTSSLRGNLKDYLHEDLTDVAKAFLFARKAHEGQFRKDGSPFFSHVLAVATLLSEINADKETVIAALLHDSVEDTEVTLDDIRDNFGQGVALLVDGVTKFSSSNLGRPQTLDYKIESLRKWLQVVQKDVRVAVMKIADRLHNMQTLSGHSNDEKQRAIAKQTLDVHVKIADRLGLRTWRRQLEDLALKYFDRESFELLSQVSEEHVAVGDRLMGELKTKFDEFGVIHNKSTFKHDPYTLFDLYLEDVHLNRELMEVLPHRYYLIVPSETACYEVLYYLHKLGHREKGSFQDYINTSAINGYQALHTTIVMKDGAQVKFKVLTREMYLNAQSGIARYCFMPDQRQRMVIPWMERIEQVTSDNTERSSVFWEGLQNDILAHSIAVYGPKDKLLLLPKICTILDASFFFLGDEAVHVEKVSANGRETFLSRRLKDGDHVDFTLSSVSKVKHEWLDLIDTKFALAEIKKALGGIDSMSQIQLGKELLQREFNENGGGLIEELSQELMQKVFEKYSLANDDQLYASIASGKISEKDVYESLMLGELQSSVSFGRKVAFVNGSLLAVSKFLVSLPEDVRDFMSYKMKKKGDQAVIKCRFDNVPMRIWVKFKRLLKRTEGVFLMREYDGLKRRNQFMFLALSTVLWIAEPIFIKSILKTSLTPLSVTALRFWAVTAFLGLIVIISRFKRKEKILSPLPLWQKDVFALSLVLMTMAYATYSGLQDSLPSNYLFASSFYPLIMLIYLLVSVKRTPWIKMGGVLTLMALAYVLVFGFNQDANWPLESRLWIMLAGLAFGLYTFFGDRIQKKLHVMLRYNRLHLLLAFYSSVIMLIAGKFNGWPDLTFSEYALAVTLGVVFTGIPHLIFFYFLRSNLKVEDTAVQLIATVAVAVSLELVVESVVYGVVPGAWKIAGMLIGMGALVMLWRIYRKNLTTS